MFASLHSFFTEYYIIIGVMYLIFNMYATYITQKKFPLMDKSIKETLGNKYFTTQTFMWSVTLLIAVVPIWSGYFLILSVVSYALSLPKFYKAEKFLASMQRA